LQAARSSFLRARDRLQFGLDVSPESRIALELG
jgi:hypothetical protein